MRISGGTEASALLMRSEPRLSGRNWQTEAVKPDCACSFSPILSVENGRKWIWISGDANRGLVLKNAPEVPAAIVNGPLRKAAYCAPASILRIGLLTTSLSVTDCAQRVTSRTCR